MNKHYLGSLFNPECVAIFGASDKPDSLGTHVMANLIAHGFQKDAIIAINPKYKEIQGCPCFATLKEAQQRPDAAIITTPARTLSAIVDQCAKLGVRHAVLLTVDLGKSEEDVEKLQNHLAKKAYKKNVRLLGPNSLGVIFPAYRMNASLYPGKVASGEIALVSQSGAVCTAILDWAATQNIGFSRVISTGHAPDIEFGEILDFLESDERTRSILLYVEGIRNARSFMSGLRAASRVKPVIVLKVGRYSETAIAARRHSGAFVGADSVYDSSLRRAGVIRGKRINDMFVAARVVSLAKKLQGENLTVLSNGGGPGVIASDSAGDYSIPLTPLSSEDTTQLDALLPESWSRFNPIDIKSRATPDHYQEAFELCANNPNTHGILVIFTPHALGHAEACAQVIIDSAKKFNDKVVLTCWMGGNDVMESRKLFTEAGIPTFYAPEGAVAAFSYLTSFFRNQKLLLQTPPPLENRQAIDVKQVQTLISQSLQLGHKQLSREETLHMLTLFGIPTLRSRVAHSLDEALNHANTIGYPIALKIFSSDISRKSEVGGVRTGISNRDALIQTYHALVKNALAFKPHAKIDGMIVEAMYASTQGRELSLGIFHDPVFGATVYLGAGGSTVKFIQSREVALPPLNVILAKDMIYRSDIAPFLQGDAQSPPAKIDALIDILMRISELACEVPEIQSLEIDPLIIDENGAIAVEARTRIAAQRSISRYKVKGRYRHLAIHPYPSYIEETSQLRNGQSVLLRPMRTEDAETEKQFFKSLSQESRYFRFMYNIKELTPTMVARFTQIDYDKEMALVAEHNHEAIGIARYVTNPDGESCEFAIAIGDDWQHLGIGRRLMEKLLDCARAQKLEIMEGSVLRENVKMLEFCQRLGFISEGMKDSTTEVLVKKALS
ncbi:MAG: bifunctional acetate--CoA ligase family protein/GNAT family N-acetyltransferase [Pseudomonadota bacterium]